MPPAPLPSFNFVHDCGWVYEANKINMYVFKVFITYILLTEVFNVNRFIKLLQGFVFFFRFLEISRGGAGLSRNR